MRRHLIPAVIAALLAPTFAVAETAPVATAKDQATADQIEAWLRSAQPVDLETDPAPGVTSGKPPARQVHGEVSVSVGTGGYRSVYMASAIPVGEDSTLYIALGESRGGRGPFAGTRRSLSLGLDMTGDRARDEDCRDEYRQTEPGPTPWRGRPPRRFGVDAEDACLR